MEHGMWGNDRKESIIKKIEDIFEIISRRSGDGGGKKGEGKQNQIAVVK